MHEYIWELIENILATKRHERGCRLDGSWTARKDFRAPKEGKGAFYLCLQFCCIMYEALHAWGSEGREWN